MNRIWKYFARAKRLHSHIKSYPGKVWLPYNREVTGVEVISEDGTTLVIFEKQHENAAFPDPGIDVFMELNELTNKDIGF